MIIGEDDRKEGGKEGRLPTNGSTLAEEWREVN